MTITLRPYAKGDAGITAEIFRRAITEVAARDYTPAQIAVWARVDDIAAWGTVRENRPTWIALVDGQPAGFADLTAAGLLDMMFVHPRFGGRGIASALLARVETEAIAAGLTRLVTEASRTARPFFEKRGFVLVRAQQVAKRGQTLENFVMAKVLAG